MREGFSHNPKHIFSRGNYIVFQDILQSKSPNNFSKMNHRNGSLKHVE